MTKRSQASLLKKSKIAFALSMASAWIGVTTPLLAANPDSITITITISNALSVDIQNSNFTHATSRALGDDFLIAQTEVLSIDNDSSTDASGLVETYQLSASITTPSSGWSLSSDGNAGADILAVLAVFSSTSSNQPASGEYAAPDNVTGTATSASTTVYYGSGTSTGKSGLSVSPTTGAERNLWLRIKLPTTSSASLSGSAAFRLYVNAISG